MSVAVAGFLSGCASMQPRDFAGTSPALDPIAFFTGRTSSTGVFEDRAGRPTKRFHTYSVGRLEDGVLQLDQTFRYDDGTVQRRRWSIQRVGRDRFEARAGDVIGVGRGEASGSSFRWSYTVQLDSGNPLTRVHLRHWMYLHDDRTLLNRATLRVLGVRVGSVSEVFRRD